MSKRTAAELLTLETLSHVFTMGVTVESGNADGLEGATTFPVIVSHVCSRWRTIALNTPRLWNKIVIIGRLETMTIHGSGTRDSHVEHLKEPGCLRRVRVFLERSKSSPLTVYIDVRSPTWYFRPIERDHLFTTDHMSPLLDYLVPHIERWEEVTVIDEAWETFHDFLEHTSRYKISGMQPQANLLRRLSLIRSNAYVALDCDRPSLVTIYRAPFKDAPALQIVELDGVHIDWIALCLHSLTELSLRYHARDVLPSALELVGILKSSPNLERLAIHGWGARSLEEGNLSELQGKVSLANIKRFSMGWVDAHYFCRLLSLFLWHIPRLESITFEDVSNSLDPLSDRDSSHLLNYVAKRITEDNGSFGPLPGPLDLALNSVRSSIDSLRHIMERLPAIRSITLHNVNDTLLHIFNPLKIRANYEFPPWAALTRIVVGTTGCTSTSHARDILDSIVLSSPRPITLHVEDLLESDIGGGVSDECFPEDRDIRDTEAPGDSSSDHCCLANERDERDERDHSFAPVPYSLSVYDQSQPFQLVDDECFCQPIAPREAYSMRSGTQAPL